MPEITKDALRAKLQQREIAPVYVLHGQETFLRDIAARTIVDLTFGKDSPRDFNQDEYSLSTPESLSSALSAAEQLPMMSERRVITIRDVRVAATSQKDTLKEDLEAALAGYLANPSPTSVVIFVADELNGNRKISKMLKKYASVTEFSPLSDDGLIRWTRDKIKEAGCMIDESSLRHLASLVGSDLRVMTNEIAKLATAAIPENVIDVDMIDRLVTQTRELSNFDVTDHLIAGRSKQALTALKKILDDGAEPLALLGLISYNFRRLLAAKEMMAGGADRSEVARAIKLRYSDQEAFLAAARRADRETLIQVLCRLADVDIAIKSSIGGGGPAGSRMQIEMLVLETAMSGQR